MASLIKTIFLKENEKDIFLSLKNQGINTKVFENKLSDLFNKVYNNFVGYYIFRQNECLYKLIILPKTINANDETAEKDFVNYLLHYYRINNKYSFDETKKIENSLLSLAFKNNNNQKESHLPLDEFEFYKYKSILESIEIFFKKHKNYKKVKVDYSSQDIKYKLNLQKNIQELDKTKLHQTRIVDMMYALIATITYNAIKLFMKNKLDDFEEENKKLLLSQCKSIINLISKKYNLDKGYKLTLLKLNSFKIEKIFKSTEKTKKLLIDIKSLFGFEQMYNDSDVSVTNRYDLSTTSFFINPIAFYEWYVYDILKKYTEANGKYILFDKEKNTNTKTQYCLESKRKKTITKSSNPDYILIDEEEKIKIVIDAKWKNIDKLSDISPSDYLKLKFDSNILKNNEYSITSYFIYPNLYDYNDVVNIKTDEKIYFNFNALQIDMKFEEDKNSLDFSYDYKIIEEKIIESSKIEKLKFKADEESIEIYKQRTEVINQLLNQDNLDNKDELFNNLDTFFINSSNKLNEDIAEYISDDIKYILDKYDDILEEDSKKFLKSSSSIYNYYKDKNYEEFDYSMPGSGLWKLVELELNTSFVWYIRIVNHICNAISAWIPLNKRKTAIFHEIDSRKKIRLNQFEHNQNKLQGVMLGGINLLLNDNEIIDEFIDLFKEENFIFQLLSKFVKNISDLRNEHAHIKAMSLEKYEQLNNLLFEQKEEVSQIEELLEFKKIIKNYIKDV